MIIKLILAGTAAAVIALPAMAQDAGMSSMGAEPGASATPPATSTTSPGMGSDSSMSSGSRAKTGMASDTAATAGADFKTGAAVKDSEGVDIGTISKVAKSGGQTMVTLQANGKTTTVPASSLSSSGGAIMSSSTKEQVWAPK